VVKRILILLLGVLLTCSIPALAGTKYGDRLLTKAIVVSAVVSYIVSSVLSDDCCDKPASPYKP